MIAVLRLPSHTASLTQVAPAKAAGTLQNPIASGPRRNSLYSSVAERQSCKLKVLGSIPSGGFGLRPRALLFGMATSRAVSSIAPLHPCAPGRAPALANPLAQAHASGAVQLLHVLCLAFCVVCFLLPLAFALFFLSACFCMASLAWVPQRLEDCGETFV